MEPSGGSARERLVSLDAFRGFVVASMLLVNTTWSEQDWADGLAGSIAVQLAHVPWNAPAQGATFTDLVFPWFLFIMGGAIPLSLRAGRGRGRSGARRTLIAARRGAILYLLGVLLTHAGSWTERPAAWSDLASWNILQLIGAAYIAATIVSLAPRWAWWAFVAAVLAAKTIAMAGIDAEWVRAQLQSAATPLAPRNPEAPTGPGTFTHYDDVKRFLAREHRPPGADRWLVGWLGMSQQWLPAAAIATLGALAVDRLTREREPIATRARIVAIAGALAIALAYALQAGYRPTGGGWLGPATTPFSKWFFTPSYCLLAAGTGAVLLAAFAWAIDARGHRRLAEPWRTYGVNALALYVGAELTWKLAFSRWKLANPSGDSAALPGAINDWAAWALPDLGAATNTLSGCATAILWLTGWWAICRWLDRRRIYLRV